LEKEVKQMSRFGILVFGIAWFLTMGWSDRIFSAEDEVLARVGNEVITRIDFETRMRSLPPAAQEEMKDFEKKKELLNNMIKARLLVAEGEKRGLNEKSDIKATMKMIRDDYITQEYVRAYLGKNVEVSDEEAQNYYNTNPRIREREYLRMSQIVVEKEEEAREILARLKKGEHFKKLARERSVDEASKHMGGEVEWLEKGKGEKEIEEALSTLEKGGLSDIIKLKGKYYILKLEDKKIEPKIPFLKVKDEIIKSLKYMKLTEVVEKEIEELRKKISVETFYDKLAPEAK
jgi:peptidyl-prolyl cis-trans isomerase C